MSINRIYLPARISNNIDGTIHIKYDKELMQSYLNELLGTDGSIDIEIGITRIDSLKTHPQLAYFFGIVLPIIKDRLEDLEGSSFTKEEIMHILKDRFFYEEIFFEGEYKKVHMSLSKAKKAEVKEFIAKCVEFATDILDVKIPEPTKPHNAHGR